MKYCFVFVCQQGELEIKSMLLAASLKQYLRCEYELVAAIPQPESRWGPISENTLILMQSLGIRSVPITNRINDNYPIGNKVACLGIETSAEQIIFLDSDILCLREFSPEPFFSAPFNAKPADLAVLTRDVALWQRMYDLFNLPFPNRRMIATVSGELMLPYFNAGMVAVQTGLGFASVWEKCCQVIDREDSITNKRPWLDQFGLSMTLTQLNLNYQCLDERFNYPTHLKPLPISLPFLAHYHWPSIIRREPRLNQGVADLVKVYPRLKSQLLNEPQWAQLLKPYALSKSRAWWTWKGQNLFLKQEIIFKKGGMGTFSKPNPEAIITGIPRSGTSYLCRLLHSIPNSVVINEPTQIFDPLNNNLTFWQIATYYQELRRDILEGKPIENKIKNGQIIEDTMKVDKRTCYQPQVSCPNFLLATKNTLAYLARVPQLKQVLPHAPIIACVRHPLDTIASWKTSFSHLKNASVAKFSIGHVNDPFLTQWQRQHLAEIVATPRLALKRALLWRYLAEIVLMNAHQLIIIRYEDLVTQPKQELNRILQQIPHAPSLSGINTIIPSSVRQKREVLDDEDLQSVSDICGECAMALGYNESSKEGTEIIE